MSAAVLAIEDLQAGYEAGAPIVRGVSLVVRQSEIVAILGPNGAGKSTLIKAIAGLVPKFSGRVVLDGQDITTVKAHELARRGLGFVPQTENVFTLMSIVDNLRLATDVLPRPERAAADRSNVCAVSRPGAPAPACGRTVVGRAAPDAGGGAGTHRKASHSHAR